MSFNDEFLSSPAHWTRYETNRMGFHFPLFSVYTLVMEVAVFCCLMGYSREKWRRPLEWQWKNPLPSNSSTTGSNKIVFLLKKKACTRFLKMCFFFSPSLSLFWRSLSSSARHSLDDRESWKRIYFESLALPPKKQWEERREKKEKMVAAFLFDKYRTVSLVTEANNEGVGPAHHVGSQALPLIFKAPCILPH